MNCYDRHYLKIALPAALEGLFMILLASTDLILRWGVFRWLR